MILDPVPLAAALARRPAVARVTVVATRGSAPREAGASMLVWGDRSPEGQSGTIGGGRLEYEAAARARALLAARGAPCATRVALGPAVGQCCGGAVTLVTEVLTAVPEGPLRALRVEGNAPRPAAPGWRDGWLVERVAPPRPPLWIWGAGHVGRALVAVLAPAEAAAITWADTAPERFPPAPPGARGPRGGRDLPGAGTAGEVPPEVRLLPAADLPALAAHAPGNVHHLIVTHDHALDLALCHALLARGFASAGLIGSATKRARFAARLRALGHPGLAPIECPIGDRSLGKHPQAIAIGVASALLPRLQAGTEAAHAPSRTAERLHPAAPAPMLPAGKTGEQGGAIP